MRKGKGKKRARNQKCQPGISWKISCFLEFFTRARKKFHFRDLHLRSKTELNFTIPPPLNFSPSKIFPIDRVSTRDDDVGVVGGRKHRISRWCRWWWWWWCRWCRWWWWWWCVGLSFLSFWCSHIFRTAHQKLNELAHVQPQRIVVVCTSTCTCTCNDNIHPFSSRVVVVDIIIIIIIGRLHSARLAGCSVGR